MDLFALVQNQVGLFFLIFVRMSGIFTAAPVFGAKTVPLSVKAGLSLIFAMVMLPPLSQHPPVIPGSFYLYLWLVVQEYFVGFIIGYAASLIFSAIQMAGTLIDTQIGFGMVNVYDPLFGESVPLIGNFKYILAVMVFLATNGHHMIISALMGSFEAVPVTQVVVQVSLVKLFVDMISNIFVIAFKISLPVLATLLLMDVGTGILARTMPQMNIFVVEMPAKIFAGLFILSISIPFYIFFIEVLFNGMYANFSRIIALLAPG